MREICLESSGLPLGSVARVFVPLIIQYRVELVDQPFKYCDLGSSRAWRLIADLDEEGNQETVTARFNQCAVVDEICPLREKIGAGFTAKPGAAGV